MSHSWEMASHEFGGQNLRKEDVKLCWPAQQSLATTSCWALMCKLRYAVSIMPIMDLEDSIQKSAKYLSIISLYVWDNAGFPGGSAVKKPPANAGDPGSIPGSGRSPREGMATHSSILAWETPWTEEPGGLQSKGLQRVGHFHIVGNRLLYAPIRSFERILTL